MDETIISKHCIFLGILINPLSMKMIVSFLFLDWYVLLGILWDTGGCPGRPPFVRADEAAFEGDAVNQQKWGFL